MTPFLMQKPRLQKLTAEPHGAAAHPMGFEFQALGIIVLLVLVALLSIPAAKSLEGDQSAAGKGCAQTMTGDIAFCH